jgi:hypothetical protein
VTNVLFARFALKKTISKRRTPRPPLPSSSSFSLLFQRSPRSLSTANRMYKGTAIIVVGVVITVLSASVVPTLEATTKELLALWTRTPWHFYLFFCVVYGCLCQGIFFISISCRKKTCMRYFEPEILEPMTYATVSALFGTLSVVQAKVLSE